MATKEHVVKVVNGATERAVMVSPTTPGTPIDSQIWFDNVKQQLAIYSAGTITPLNCRVLAGDPPAPLDGETWVNAGTNEFKYRYLGATYSISLGANTGGASPQAGNYYAILTEEELGQISNIGQLYPNYITDAFNSTESDAVYTDVAPQGSALRLVGSDLTGNVKYNLPTSTVVNDMEGIAVYTPNTMTPLSIVNNADGTSTITAAGDMTPYLATGSEMMFYNQSTDGSGNVSSIYVTGNDNFPLVAPIITTGPAPASHTYAAPAFAAGITTFTVQTATTSALGIDIMSQLGTPPLANVRFFANDLTVQAGGNGTAGSMDTIKIVDAHGLANLRTLGGDALNYITSDLTTNINKINVKKSPAGQYCLIQVIHTLAADYMEFVYYYSNDGMLTLNRIVPTYLMSRLSNEIVPYDNLNSDSSDQIPWQGDRLMQLNDDGKFALIQNIFNDAGYVRPRLCFGNLNDASPALAFAPGIGDGPGVVMDADSSPHIQGQGIAMDSGSNYVVVNVVYQNNHIMRTAWYSNSGATFLGISDQYVYDYNGNTAQHLAWYPNLEGQVQAVYVGIDAINGYAQIFKKKLSEILAATPYVGNQAAFEMEPFFANQTNQYMMTSEGTCFPMNVSADADKLRTTWWSDSNDRMIYGEIDMVAPNPGRDEIQLISFSAVPTSGQWNLQFGGDTTSPNFGFGDNASVVQAALRALSSINGPYVNVTGNYTSGFTVEFIGTMGLMPQALLINPSDTLSNGSPVTINITETQLGQTPVYPTFNGAGFRHLATGDKVLMDAVDADNITTGGGYVDASTAQFAYSSLRTWKPHPSNTNRAFMALPVCEVRLTPYGFDAQVYQLDNLATFQGQFNDTTTGAAGAMGLGAQVAANYGDRVGGLITWDRNINVRTIGVRGSLTWVSYSIEVPRGQNVSLGAKLVGVSGGIPNESIVYEVSPTTYNIYDYQQPQVYDLHFRFNQNVTNGQQMFLVVYINNLTPSTDWPLSNGGTLFNLASPAGSNTAYYQGGVWTAGTVGFGYRAYDFDIEPVKTPDMNQFPLFDLGQSDYGALGVAGQISEVQLDYNPAKTAMQLSYTIGARFDSTAEGTNGYVSNRTVCYRTFNIPAAGTFMQDQNHGFSNSVTSSFASGASSIVVSSAIGLKPGQQVIDVTTPGNIQAGTMITSIVGSTIGLSRPTAGVGSTDSLTISSPTMYFGYDPATFDHNLLLQVRLADPLYPLIDRFGNFRYQSPGNPLRGIDIAGGGFFNYTGGSQFDLNNVSVGSTVDARFKSGWATHFNNAGYISYFLGSHGSFKGAPFTVEVEYVPTAADITSGGYLLQYGNGNGWLLYIQPGGNVQFTLQNTGAGPALVTGATTTTSSTVVVNQYYKIRVTRDAATDNIRIFWATSSGGSFTEQPYITQTNMNRRTLYNENDNLYIGATYSNASLINGYIGEVKLSSGANSFLNGDGLADQRPIIGHHNLGDRIIGKYVYDNGTVGATADDSRLLLTKGIMSTPGATTALRAGYDQLFTYQDTNLPQGKILAAELTLTRVSAADGPAVQGFLFNYLNTNSPNNGSFVAPSLGTAAMFEILAGTTVTNTGASAVTGQLGVSPGTTATGFPPGTVSGAQHLGDASAAQAQSDLVTAYNGLVARPFNVDLTGQDMGGMTLTPGVYKFSSSAAITGTLTLDAQGNSAAVWVFQIGSTLTTASSAAITLVNGAVAGNVFFQVGSSATIGTSSVFRGNILAQTSITLNTGASMVGRALAISGAVTMDDNAASLP